MGDLWEDTYSHRYSTAGTLRYLDNRFLIWQWDLGGSFHHIAKSDKVVELSMEFMEEEYGFVTKDLSKGSTTYTLIRIFIDWISHLLVEYSKNGFVCEYRRS